MFEIHVFNGVTLFGYVFTIVGNVGTLFFYTNVSA